MESWRKELYLKHHGILGQKWGVRRTPEELGHYKGKGYRFDIKVDGDITLKKGSTLHRVSTHADSKRTGYMYASFTEKDVLHYQVQMTDYLNELSFSKGMNGVKTFDLSAKLTDDIHLPSEQKKVDTFLSMMKDKKISDEVIRAYQDRIIRVEHDGFRFQALSQNVKNMGLPSEIANLYSAFSFGLYSSKTLRDTFFSKLFKSGYDGIIDTEDAFTEAEAPLILFNRNKLSFVNVKQLPEPTFDWMDEMEAKEKQAPASKITTFKAKSLAYNK